MQTEQLRDEARRAGFEQFAELKTDTLRFLPQVREMCRADRCHSFGKSWACPPGCGTLEACAARAAKYRRGILVQTVGEVEDSFDIEGMQSLEKKHKKNFQKFVRKLRKTCPGLLPMGAGACSLCKTCTYPEKPCRFPEQAFASMEACGLWVSEVCEKNGLRYNYGPNHIAYTSCVLVD
jgi:predicted metal-binding protein